MPTTLDLAGWLDERQERFTAIADAIWAKPEVALREPAACALQAETLAADGFAITRDVGGLPTAFVAEWGSGQPVLGFLGEYDALPGLSQESQATQAPIAADGPGHGCGHNLLGTAALAAAMALKAWLKETGQAGAVRYYGCPAEEMIVGKVYMARAGVFDDLDAALTWHPGWLNTVSLGSSLAVDNLKFRFHGKTAHAAVSPEQGRSALDAVELMNVGVNFLREHVPRRGPHPLRDHQRRWRAQRRARRSGGLVLRPLARARRGGGADRTGTQNRPGRGADDRDHRQGRLPVRRIQSAAESRAGRPCLRDDARTRSAGVHRRGRAYAQTVAGGYPAGAREAVLRVAGLSPDLLQQALNGDVHPASDEGKVMPGSTDVGDVSWITPTVSLGTACWALGIPGHSWGIVATGAMSIGHKGMLYAAQALAVTAAELVSGPAHLARPRRVPGAHRRAVLSFALAGGRDTAPAGQRALTDGLQVGRFQVARSGWQTLWQSATASVYHERATWNL